MNEFQPQLQVTQHFDDVSRKYFNWYAANDSGGHSFRIRKVRCMELLTALPRGSRVLDVGCGPATMVQELLDRGYDVTGTDIAPQMIDECKNRFAKNPHVTFAVAPANKQPVENASQDAVTAMGLLEYLNNEDEVLQEFQRILKPGGLALITYPHYWSPARAWDRIGSVFARPILALTGRKTLSDSIKHREYHLHQTRQMIQAAGFEIQDVVFYNFKVGLRPLDSLFPALFVKIAEKLELLCRAPGLRRIGTGFIVAARRP